MRWAMPTRMASSIVTSNPRTSCSPAGTRSSPISAARAATEAGAQKLTQTGMAVGTPVYMAPEQSVGDAIGPTADLYSLGCMLYEMLAGEPPFTAKNPQALMARHAMEAVPSIRIVRNTVPEEVEDAIFASMAKV